MSEIELERRGSIALITLNAPERRNALGRQMAADLLAVLAEVDRDPALGVTVLRGADGHFCAGAERSLLADAGADPAGDAHYAALGLVYEVFAAVDRLATPTIAALRGWSVGAGVNLAMAADVRVIAEDATLRSGFSQIALHPGGGHFTLISRESNRQAAVAMSLLGQDVRGAEAVRLGLAWECVPDAEVEDRCLALAAAVTDPALSRTAVANLRHETTAGHLDLRAATQLERASQLWSLRRR
ncbi:enoyl-CoA hydratase/isomerase family protein [Naumannella sp. ID2617S]|nr:enoyl-CoA hydratase/isomerase family protein [Naumannella sp. ID2617S]